MGNWTTKNCWDSDSTHGGQGEEWYAENGAECCDEFTGPRDRNRIAVTDCAQRYLHIYTFICILTQKDGQAELGWVAFVICDTPLITWTSTTTTCKHRPFAHSQRLVRIGVRCANLQFMTENTYLLGLSTQWRGSKSKCNKIDFCKKNGRNVQVILLTTPHHSASAYVPNIRGFRSFSAR